MIDPTPSAPPSGDGSSGARWLAAAVAGLVLAASFPPFGWGICAWFALVPLLWALADARPGASAGRGYLCGLLFMAGVGYFTTSFGGEVFWMRVLPWVLFTAIEALYFIPIALALSAILRRGQTWAVLLGVPAVWAVGEWARGAGSLGFPFGMLGYALHDESGVIQAAALGGVYLVSALAAMVSTGLYLLLFGGFAVRRPVLLSLSAVVIVVLWGLGVVSREQDNAHLAAPRATVIVAQGSTHTMWGDPAGLVAYEALERETLAAARRAQSPIDLVVWSESSVPGYLLDDGAIRARAARVSRTLDAPLLTGTIGQTPDGRPANLSVLLGPDGAVAGTYQKRRLVPFGEWVPFRNVLPLLDSFGVVEEDEVPGTAWTVLSHGKLKLGTPICFESAAPSIARTFVRDGANVLVVITNDAWFFHTGMAEQHADAAQLRAVETGRWVVRCGLTGISGFISPRGVWTGKLPLDHAGSLVGSVNLETGTTPFVRFGDWFLYLCLLVVAGVFLEPRVRRSRLMPR